jgi:hypothetical protein
MSEKRGVLIRFPGVEDRKAKKRPADFFTVQRVLKASLVTAKDDETVLRLYVPSQAQGQGEYTIAFRDEDLRAVIGAAEISISEPVEPMEDETEGAIVFEGTFGKFAIYPNGRIKLQTMLPRDDFKPQVEMGMPGEMVCFSSDVFSIRFPSDVRRTYSRLYHADQFGEYSLKAGVDEDGLVWSVASFTIEPFMPGFAMQ